MSKYKKGNRVCFRGNRKGKIEDGIIIERQVIYKVECENAKYILTEDQIKGKVIEYNEETKDRVCNNNEDKEVLQGEDKDSPK